MKKGLKAALLALFVAAGMGMVFAHSAATVFVGQDAPQP